MLKLFELKCVLAACVHNHPIMIKIYPVFFFLSTKIFTPFSNRAVCLCDVTRTEASPTIVDLQERFSTDCTGVVPQTHPEWAVIGGFTARADVDKNDS